MIRCNKVVWVWDQKICEKILRQKQMWCKHGAFSITAVSIFPFFVVFLRHMLISHRRTSDFQGQVSAFSSLSCGLATKNFCGENSENAKTANNQTF